MKIKSIDHIVMTVKSIENSVEFYTKVLGMEKVVFGKNRVALKFGEQKINLHQLGNIVDDNVLHATAGAVDICLITEDDPNAIVKHLSENNVEIISGPCERTGANGKITSVYFYDPDENLIEVSTY